MLRRRGHPRVRRGDLHGPEAEPPAPRRRRLLGAQRMLLTIDDGDHIQGPEAEAPRPGPHLRDHLPHRSVVAVGLRLLGDAEMVEPGREAQDLRLDVADLGLDVVAGGDINNLGAVILLVALADGRDGGALGEPSRSGTRGVVEGGVVPDVDQRDERVLLHRLRRRTPFASSSCNNNGGGRRDQ
ncbi:Os06g0683925, partial [Oryza sativa Japonica Group]